ncbi:MAG: hypothetical protein Q7R91_02450 [bacterium]|nr:hypothetical protein [bacterium]
MTEQERFPLLFDKEIVRMSIKVSEKDGEGWSIPIGPGASVVLNHEFVDITVDKDNSLTMYSAKHLTDPYYPVINVETYEIVGLFSPIPLLCIYERKRILKGDKIELGRYLAFVPNWRVVHEAMKENYNGKPGSALFIPN